METLTTQKSLICLFGFLKLNMTTVNDNVPKKDILISRENVKLRE